MMIPTLMTIAMLAAQAAPAEAPSARQVRFDACATLAGTDPEAALEQANRWRLEGGGLLARKCQGLAYTVQERWAPAAVAFEQAARDAEVERDGSAANLWVQAGNARLAAGEAQAARAAFDAALASGVLTGDLLGEAHLDRARAAVALNDAKGARADLDQAVKLVPADPLAWLLSATLARRDGDLERARIDIAEAAKRSPDDAAVALEAGNIAMLSGAPEAARVAWQGAVANQPDSPAGKAAADALARLDKPGG
jgi:hypothetical protein